MRMRIRRGFSLIELLIIVAMLVILATIVRPTYLAYVIKIHRLEGEAALLDLAHRMERYYTQHNTYKGATLKGLNMPALSSQQYYSLDIAASYLDHHQYLIRAIPQGTQINDTFCGTLTLNQTGEKGITGTGRVSQCW